MKVKGQWVFVILLIVLASLSAQDYFEDQKNSKWTIGISGWFVTSGEASYSTTGPDVTTGLIEVHDNYDTDNDGIYGILDVRYEQWGVNTFWSINFSAGYNPNISGDAGWVEKLSLISDGTPLGVFTIETDSDGETFDVILSPSYGMGSQDGFQIEFGTGVHYQRMSIEMEDAIIAINGVNQSEPSGLFADYKGDYFGLLLDITVRFPLESSGYLWLQLYSRFYPLTYVDAQYNESNTNTLDPIQDHLRDTAFGNAWQLEISLIGYLYRSKAFSVKLEGGYRYFHWKTRDLETDYFDKRSGTGLADEKNGDFVQIRQKGPFIGMAVEF